MIKRKVYIILLGIILRGIEMPSDSPLAGDFRKREDFGVPIPDAKLIRKLRLFVAGEVYWMEKFDEKEYSVISKGHLLALKRIHAWLVR